MRNKGFRLEESFGMMHFYDLDLSLQYIDAGDKVYCVAVDVWHMAENQKQSTRSKDEYLQAVGGSDDDYYEDVREEFRAKWQHLLPIWRGERDEVYEEFYDEEYERLEAEYKKSVAVIREAETYVRKLERDWDQKNNEIADIAGYARALEAEVARLSKLAEADSGRAWRAYLKLKSIGHIGKKPPGPPDALPPLSQ